MYGKEEFENKMKRKTIKDVKTLASET